METTKEIEDFLTNENEVKPQRDSCFNKSNLERFCSERDYHEAEFTHQEVLAFAELWANQQSTSQKETIERLREALSKSSAIIWDVLEEGVEGSFPIRSQYDKNLQLLIETNLHNYEIPERDTNTKL